LQEAGFDCARFALPRFEIDRPYGRCGCRPAGQVPEAGVGSGIGIGTETPIRTEANHCLMVS